MKRVVPPNGANLDPTELSMSILRATLAGAAMLGATALSFAQDIAPENRMTIELKDGPVVIGLRPDLAPQHVERLKELAGEGFYDGVVFHRVIDGFMAQTGDPTGTGTGGSDKPDLPAEFTTEVSFERGTVGMARTSDPNSANSQFFIMFDSAPHLNGDYTVVGEVIEGMDNVDAIKRGAGGGGMVDDPDKMIKVTVGS